MGAINLSITFFYESDGFLTPIDQRIESAINLIENENDYILIDKVYTCSNEKELRALLSKKNILWI